MQKIPGQNNILLSLTADENKRFTDAVRLSFLYLRAKKMDRSAESVAERIRSFGGNEFMEKIAIEDVDAKMVELQRKGAFKTEQDMNGRYSYGRTRDDYRDAFDYSGYDNRQPERTHSIVQMSGDECDKFISIMKNIRSELLAENTEFNFPHVQQRINLKVGQRKCETWMKHIDPNALRTAVGTMKSGAKLSYKNGRPNLFMPINDKANGAPQPRG